MIFVLLLAFIFFWLYKVMGRNYFSKANLGKIWNIQPFFWNSLWNQFGRIYVECGLNMGLVNHFHIIIGFEEQFWIKNILYRSLFIVFYSLIAPVFTSTLFLIYYALVISSPPHTKLPDPTKLTPSSGTFYLLSYDWLVLLLALPKMAYFLKSK